MGVVYEAIDRRRDSPVAIKTLTRIDPDAVYQLKSEFRTIAGLTHPNLVSLYELHAADGVWFITMELVGGRPFSEHVVPGALRDSDAPTHTQTPTGPEEAGGDGWSLDRRRAGVAPLPAPVCDLERLGAALPQLVDGVRAIHAAGKLHRDLKPSNVLVTESGRVVILDFGIAADLPGSRRVVELTSLPYAGTPIYMAPEQYGAGELTAAADWYAMGVMLFEALTGQPPFRAVSIEALAVEKSSADADPPSTICQGVPEHLNTLCGDLLRRDPARRPDGEAIAQRLRASTGTVAARVRDSASDARVVLVGRDQTLADLRATRTVVQRDGALAVFLQGRSGMGKSAVLQAFLESCDREPHTVVLSGRCFEAESVPFKALDALMDSLARHLRKIPATDAAGLLPRRADVLARMFPTLLRVPVFAEAPQGRSTAKDAVEARQIASAALREMVGRLADRTSLVIAIDDLQWGDLDSAQLIAELVAPPDPPPILLIVAARSEQTDSPCLSYLRQPSLGFRRQDLDLQPLTAADVAQLHAGLHPGAPPLASDRAARIAADAGGNPFIIREVLDAGVEVEAGQEAVAQMIRGKVARLDAASRRLIEVVSLSAKPLDVGCACEAAGITGDSQLILTGLRNGRLVRSTGAEDLELVETYHDRIRETVAGTLTGEALRESHERLAHALGSRAGADAEHVASHLEGAGHGREAAELLLTAAQQASQALAFDHAVMLYERALRLSPDRRSATTVARLAEALAEAGRSSEAADRFAEASALADASARREYARRAAYYFCISGRIDQGKATLGDVLRQFGISLPGSKGTAIASVLAARARLWFRGLKYTPRFSDDLGADERERLDSLWAAAIGLGNTEVISGIGFSTRGLLQALDAGDPARIVRAMSWEACLRAVDDVKSAERLIDRAETIIKTCETPYLRGMILLARAIYTLNLTRFRDAIPLFDEAESLWLEHGHGVDWEVNTARHFCSWSMLYAGEYAEALRRMTIQQREAAGRGNLYMTVSMGSYAEPLALLAAGQPERARARRAEVMGLWTEQHFNVQHIIAMLAEIQACAYEGRGPEALEAARRESAAAHTHGFDRLAVGRISTDYLTLNSVFLTIGADPSRTDVLQDAARAIKRLSKESPGWGPAAAAAGRAGVAVVQGDRSAAAEHLERSASIYAGLGMTGYASYARRNLGVLVGGDRGRDLISDADTWLRAHGVADPERFASVCIRLPLGANYDSGNRFPESMPGIVRT
jgi:tetratricopeptide (TPR) repeat protein